MSTPYQDESLVHPASHDIPLEQRQLAQADGLLLYRQATWVFVFRAMEMMALSACYHRLVLDPPLWAQFAHPQAQNVFVLLFFLDMALHVLFRHLNKHSAKPWALQSLLLCNILIEGVLVALMASLSRVDPAYLSLGAFLMGMQNLQCLLHFSLFRRATRLSLLFSLGVYLVWSGLELWVWRDPRWAMLHEVWAWYIVYGAMLTHDLNRLVVVHMDDLSQATSLRLTQLERYFILLL